MAKRRRKSRSKRRRGTGSVIRVRKLSGVDGINNPNSAPGAILPVLIGGGVTTLVAIGVQQYVEPTTDSNVMLRNNAPWVGAAAGIVTGLALYNMTGRAAGLAAMSSSALLAVALWGINYAAQMRMQAAAGAPAANGTAGIGAVVPEYSMRGLGRGRGGTGAAIAMEPQASRGYGAGPLGSYGETVNLGAINTSAFGTPGFSLGAGYGGGRRY